MILERIDCDTCYRTMVTTRGLNYFTFSHSLFPIVPWHPGMMKSGYESQKLVGEFNIFAETVPQYSKCAFIDVQKFSSRCRYPYVK